MSKSADREYGAGSVFQRHLPDCPPVDPTTKRRPDHKCEGRWIGQLENGSTGSGGRRRPTVSGRTEAQVRRKLRDKQADKRAGLIQASRATIKSWSVDYLAIRIRELSPKGYNATANPIKNWIVPTIGTRRLEQLTTRDIRAVQDAQRAAGRQHGDTHRVLMTMLRTAVTEGHHVPAQVLAMKSPKPVKSDREAMTVDQGIACLAAASEMPNGSRWLFTLLYGARMGECLGLTWGAVDLDAGEFGEAVIEWQLQTLPYLDRADKAQGFRVPDAHESRRLVDGYHLVRPKSAKGYRVAPLLEPVRDGLLRWREIAPTSPHGLVWARPNGRPINDRTDRREWHSLQAAAMVAHPSGRPFHVHECRNFAATMLLEAGVPEHVVTDLLGHSTVATSLRYRTVRREPLMDAMRRVGERLQLG